MASLPRPAHAAVCPSANQVFFSSNTNVTDILVQCINQETVRLDISSWYLSEHSISIAVANRFAAGVKVRVIGDRGANSEADPHTKTQSYYMANLGIPIRLRFNPELVPPKSITGKRRSSSARTGRIRIRQFRADRAGAELARTTTTTIGDVHARSADRRRVQDEVRSDVERHDGRAAEHHWRAAVSQGLVRRVRHRTKGCDFRAQFPNAAPMAVNMARVEPDVPFPPDLIFAQGADFNSRLTQEINSENNEGRHHRLSTRSRQHHAGAAAEVPGWCARPNHRRQKSVHETALPGVLADAREHRQVLGRGRPRIQNNHAGVTHMKTLITSDYATNASSNFGRTGSAITTTSCPPRQAHGLPGVQERVSGDVLETTDFIPLVSTPPNRPMARFPRRRNSVPVTTSLTVEQGRICGELRRLLGTSPSAMSLVASVTGAARRQPAGTPTRGPHRPRFRRTPRTTGRSSRGRSPT